MPAAELLHAEQVEKERPSSPRGRERKILVRRPVADRSQAIRRVVQCLFIVLNLSLGFQFYLFVRQFEPGGQFRHLSRPAGVEGWLPIAGMMNLKYLCLTGRIPDIHPAAMFLLIAFLLMSIVFRKSFCSWLCPIGSLSEALWKAGRRLLRKNWTLPRWLDVPLRGLKYLLFGFFLYAVAGMSAETIRSFFAGPYGLVADVKMLNFFRFLSQTAVITLAALALLSLFFQNFWCRYLCPYGALMGLAALFSPARIRREPEKCIDCAKCTKACPALLPVDKLITVRSAECTSCLECTAVCPAQGALQFSFPRKRRLPVWVLAGGLTAIFLATVIIAKWNGTWDSHISEEVYRSIVPIVGQLSHP